jgi:two-component system phosphate regulon sensor histidine kinase PhoR
MNTRHVFWSLMSVWAGLGLAVGIMLLVKPAALAAGLAVCAGIMPTTVIIIRDRRQQRRLRSLASDARRLLSMTSPVSGPATPVVSTSSEAGASDELRGALNALGDRMSRQIKELLKKSRNLEALIDGLPEPVIVTGDGDRVLLCNRAAERLISLQPGQMTSRSIRELFTRPELLALHDSARQGEQRRAQISLTTASGQRTFEVGASPLPAAWGAGVFGAVLVLRDVTDLARAVEKQREFVANASHELRTPVAALRIAVETLQDSLGDEDASVRERFLGICAAHVQRLEEMIRDLLDLSRAEAQQLTVRPAVIDLADLEHSLRLVFEPICAERSLRMHFAIDRSLTGCRTDPKLLQLIVRNLVDNATKFAREQTVISVRMKMSAPIAQGSGGAGSPTAAANIDKARLVIEVQDRGQGIPLAQQERVFERFYQVDTARTGVTGRRGSGLGLALVKHACVALGAEISLDSVWGAGTTVKVSIPIDFEAPIGK